MVYNFVWCPLIKCYLHNCVLTNHKFVFESLYYSPHSCYALLYSTLMLCSIILHTHVMLYNTPHLCYALLYSTLMLCSIVLHTNVMLYYTPHSCYALLDSTLMLCSIILHTHVMLYNTPHSCYAGRVCNVAYHFIRFRSISLQYWSSHFTSLTRLHSPRCILYQYASPLFISLTRLHSPRCVLYQYASPRFTSLTRLRSRCVSYCTHHLIWPRCISFQITL